MSLTYQPFADVPEIHALGNELKRNVNDIERYGSVAAGAGILASALFSHGLGRLLMLGVAGALVYRGITGHCHLYEKLGVSTRDADPVGSLPGPGETTSPSQEPTQMAA